MGHWAKSPWSRQQIVLFSPRLEDAVGADHPVRLFDEVLGMIDFTRWEQEYARVEGQPPIHPRVMAAVILYGLSLGIRSSRKLEEATGNRLDFIWLCEGRTIDHSTLAGFRTRFEDQLKDLFRQIGKVVIGMGMANLNQVSLDGTVKRSNNSRYATARAASLAQKLAALDEQVAAMLAEAKQTDEREDDLYGESSPMKLPRGLRDIKARQERLREALNKIESMTSQPPQSKSSDGPDPKQGAESTDPGTSQNNKGPSVPTTDPDSSVIKNKSGGFAPNYTLLAGTEGQNGFIVGAMLAEGNDEPGSVMPVVRDIAGSFGQIPGELLADSNFNTGPNLQELHDQQIEPLMPPRQEFRDNPALREDPMQPVPESQRAKLPISPQQKVLDKSAFIYDSNGDCYHCPMGRKLEFAGTNAYVRDRVKGTYRIYESNPADCAGCPLAARCLRTRSSSRRVLRDEYEPLREAMAARMNSAEGKAKYKRRSFLCETPFAVMSTTMNVRQMLLRGKRKVQMEWRWICSAYNLKKLVWLLKAQRALMDAGG